MIMYCVIAFIFFVTIQIHAYDLTLIKPCVQVSASYEYSSFKADDFFNIELLKNNAAIAQRLNDISEQSYVEDSVRGYIFTRFFNRQSKKLLVIGGGFPTPCERLAPFLSIFSEFDILLFDYQGMGKSYQPKSFLGSRMYQYFGVDMFQTFLGVNEHGTIQTIVDDIRKYYSYDKIYGLGLCFSSYIFAQAQAENPSLFDKLILDGSWPTLEYPLAKIVAYPSLIFGQQPPFSPCLCITDSSIIKMISLALVSRVTGTDICSAPSLASILKKVLCPVLFIQCKDDCYCPEDVFDDLVQSTATHFKVVIKTNNMHGRNHIKDKELYAMLGNAFFNQDSDVFGFLMKQYFNE